MTRGDGEDGFFYHILTRIMDYLSCSLLTIPHSILKKKHKKASKKSGKRVDGTYM